MKASQFLLCPVDIKDKNIWSKLITGVGSMNETQLTVKGWELNNDCGFHYQESCDYDFSYRDALRNTRNFTFLSNTRIEQSEDLDRDLDCLTIRKRDTSLVIDCQGNFLFIICYQMTINSGTVVTNAVKSLFENRSIVKNIGDNAWLVEQHKVVKEEAAKYVNAILKDEQVSSEIIKLEPDSFFPLFVSHANAGPDLHELFCNEENLEQRTGTSLLANDYQGAYFHVGWNYTLALHFPKEVNESIFSLMVKMQMSYYTFRYYKDYFNRVFGDLFQNAQRINSRQVDFFDRLQLNYHNFLTNYYQFKFGLFPKFNTEVDQIEKLWHMDKDMALIDRIFAAQEKFVNKKYEEAAQAINAKQNKALSFIVFAQVIMFLSVIYDSVAFEAKNPQLFWVSLCSVMILIAVLITRFLYIEKR